jgi:DNA polymerase III alpha subunit
MMWGMWGQTRRRSRKRCLICWGGGMCWGVFQVEGAGMRRLMMEMRPRRFDHIIAAISLYRPGPMEQHP